MGYNCWLLLKKLEESVKGRNLPYPLLGGHSLNHAIGNKVWLARAQWFERSIYSLSRLFSFMIFHFYLKKIRSLIAFHMDTANLVGFSELLIWLRDTSKSYILK